MKRWAMVIDGTVRCTFTGDDDPNKYPDIAQWLREVGPEVKDNMRDEGGGVYAYPQQPEPEPTKEESTLTKLATLTPEQLDALIALATTPKV